MRAFAGGYYRNLKALYDYLGIRYRSQPFLFNFAAESQSPSTCPSARPRTYFVHASNLHQRAPRPSAIGIIPYCAQVVYLIACYAWFSLCCFLVAPQTGESLQQYVDRTYVPRYFVTYYLVPLLSSVATCPHESLLMFPASDITEYKRRTHGAPHYTVAGGVRGVQDRLVQGIPCELNANVTAVVPLDKGVEVSWTKRSGSDLKLYSEYFDRVILAVPPDVVGRIFEPLQYHMSRIPTVAVESVIHTDRSVLVDKEGPIRDKYAAQLIYLQTTTEGVRRTESHHIQPCGRIVSTCPYSSIKKASIFHSANFSRVLRSTRSQQIVNTIFGDSSSTPCLVRSSIVGENSHNKPLPHWKNGQDNVWLVGGWCWDGMVLLEGCVVSAMRVADDLGVKVPWREYLDNTSV